MNLLVVNNLSSGFQNGAIYDFLRYALADGDTCEVRCTDGTTPIASLLEGAEGFDAVVASGGDGTITAIAYELAYSGIPILPFPAGTGNLLVNNLKLPYEPLELAHIVRAMDTLDFDMGEITSGGETRGFTIMAGAGYDATIMKEAIPGKKTLGPLAYVHAAVTNALPQESEMHLVVDDQVIDCTGLGVIVVNFPNIQFDIPITPDSDGRDGLFDVAVLKAHNALGLIPALIAGILDREGEHPSRSESVDIYRGNTVTMEANPRFNIQYDGETPGTTTPFTARVMPRAARFVVGPQMLRYYREKGDIS